jgi:hypothetical protein
LDRHLVNYRDWHKSLGLFQYMLNCSSIPGIKSSPYFGVFGRAPLSSPLLEGPQLPTATPEGDVFLRSFHGRVSDLHQQLHDTSQEVRLHRQERRNAQAFHSHKGPRPFQVGDYVWVIYKDWQRAAYIRKHGRGAPWKKRYKVIAVSDAYGVKLEVDAHNDIQPWQSKRRCTLAAPELYEPHVMAPPIAANGEYLAPEAGSTPQVSDETSHMLKRIIDAKEGEAGFNITVEWDKLDGPTIESYEKVYPRCITAELKNQLANAMEVARLRAGHSNSVARDLSSTEVDQLFVVDQICKKETSGRRNLLERLSQYYTGMIKAFRWMMGNDGVTPTARSTE